MKYRRQRGFLVLEILIAGLILTASISTTMYLFRMGYKYLEKANQSNVLSSKLIETAGLLKTLELDKKTGLEDIGEGVKLKWEAQLQGLTRPMIGDPENLQPSLHELYLYKVAFVLDYQGVTRSYQVNVFRYKPLSPAEEIVG